MVRGRTALSRGLKNIMCHSFTEELQEAERQREQGDSAPTVRAKIPFSACMAALNEPEILTDFWSSAVQAKTTATKYGGGGRGDTHANLRLVH